MSSTVITSYLGSGLASARPASPSVATGCTAFYYATDTGVLSAYNGSVWKTVAVDSGVSAALDTLGSTQGDILYRNGTVWTRLAAGTSGQVLRTNGAAQNPSWADPATGAQGFNHFFTPTGLTKPVAASFSVLQNAGGTGTVTDLASNRGMQITVPSTGASSSVLAEQAVTSQSSFTAILHTTLANPLGNSPLSYGIGVKDNAGKIAQFGGRNMQTGDQKKAEFRFSAIGTFSSSVEDNTYSWENHLPIWLKLQLTGGNFVLSGSMDGETYIQFVSVSQTAYLTSTLSTIGPMLYVNDNGKTVSMNCWSWTNI